MKHNFAHDSSLIVRTSYLKMTIRPSIHSDIDVLLTIFAHAREQMAADGNPTQWGDGYPSCQQLEEDIRRGVSYVIEQDGEVYATYVFIIGDDPTYDIIEDGTWLNDEQPYGTINRIASNGQVMGVFDMTRRPKWYWLSIALLVSVWNLRLIRQYAIKITVKMKFLQFFLHICIFCSTFARFFAGMCTYVYA